MSFNKRPCNEIIRLPVCIIPKTRTRIQSSKISVEFLSLFVSLARRANVALGAFIKRDASILRSGRRPRTPLFLLSPFHFGVSRGRLAFVVGCASNGFLKIAITTTFITKMTCFKSDLIGSFVQPLRTERPDDRNFVFRPDRLSRGLYVLRVYSICRVLLYSRISSHALLFHRGRRRDTILFIYLFIFFWQYACSQAKTNGNWKRR